MGNYLTLKVFLILIPVVMGLLTTFAEVKRKEKKRLTKWGITVALLTAVYLGLAVWDNSRVLNEQKQSNDSITLLHRHIDTLNAHTDTLNSHIDSLKGSSDAYYKLLIALGYKLDTSSAEGKHKFDSLMDYLNMLYPSNLTFCLSDSNLKEMPFIKYYEYFFVKLCNNGIPIHNLTINEYAIQKLNGQLMAIDYVKPWVKENELASGGSFSSQVRIESSYYNDSVYLYLIGSYSDNKGHHPFEKLLLRANHLDKVDEVVDQNKKVLKYLMSSYLWRSS